MWKDRDPFDARIREDETVFYEGREWLYGYSPSTSTLRRMRLDGSTHDLIRIEKLPTSPLALTQRFYFRRRMVHPRLDRRPLRAKGPSAKWYRNKKPVVAQWSPESLDLVQLQGVYDKLHPGRPRTFRQRDTVLARVREALEARDLRLVNVIPPGAGGFTVTDNLHVIPSMSLPPTAFDARDLRKSRFLLTDVITVLSPLNPKRPGTAGWKRFEKYRTGMTVGEYCDAVGDRGKARADVVYDWDRSYIQVSRDGVVIE